ncbi:serine hydrolase-domain-containing protein [Hypoxylon sp. FL1150]|nr:serine hydrolase-domain-containing protein [Hypoxylon sp. FL1150]
MNLSFRSRPLIWFHSATASSASISSRALTSPHHARPYHPYRPHIRSLTSTTSMSAPATIFSSTAAPPGKTELKILMLHGFTQSGSLFSSKTKALSKLLTKTLSPAPFNLHPTLIFPTAPHRLRSSDIPGWTPSSDNEGNDEDSDSWAWFRKDEATGAYRGLEAGMEAIAAAIRAAGGGIDGVCGFSQGGAMAALVASAMEHPLRVPPESTAAGETERADWTWVESLRAANGGQPLKFCVVYSGFYAPLGRLSWLYEPEIATPSIQFVGSLDTVVDETRTQGLIDRSRDPQVVTHPGGHYVPVAKDWVMVLAGWLRQQYSK